MTRNTRTKDLALSKLLLDSKNPRLGGDAEHKLAQVDLVAKIIDLHGISDLLSSMSMNGFFDAEPIVGVENEDGTYTIVEGNRRLVTALVLTQEPRASAYKDIAKKYLANANPEIITSLSSLPVTIFPKRNNELIAYMGAKHIRGNKPWDSYAKAHWLFELLASSSLSLSIEEAARLIGDSSTGTIKKILEGYILMSQLQKQANYESRDSTIRGKGSNVDYPFSWIYTAIGYENIRKWMDLTGLDSQGRIDSNTKVLHTSEGIENADKLAKFLFGSKSRNFRASIRESRELRDLNSIILNKISVKDLENGELAADINERQRPVNKRLFDLFYRINKDLEIVSSLVTSEDISELKDLEQIQDLAKKSIKMLQNVSAIISNTD